MKQIVALVSVLLIGCSGTLQTENRLACTVANDKLYVVSEYGQFGLSREIAEADRAVICLPPSQ